MKVLANAGEVNDVVDAGRVKESLDSNSTQLEKLRRMSV